MCIKTKDDNFTSYSYGHYRIKKWDIMYVLNYYMFYKCIIIVFENKIKWLYVSCFIYQYAIPIPIQLN